MADFNPILAAIKSNSSVGTPNVGIKGLTPTNLTQTYGSEALLLQEVLTSLFPQYLNTGAVMSPKEPKNSLATAAFDPGTKEVLMGNMTLGGDVQWEGANKKYSRSKFTQEDFIENLLTTLHELGHAQRWKKGSVTSSADPAQKGAAMSDDNYNRMQKILSFAAQEGFPSMSQNAFGTRSLEEFLVEVQAMKDVRDAGFTLPKKVAARLDKVEQVQAAVPWFDNYIKSQNRPDSPTLKETPSTTVKIPSPKDIANAARDTLTSLIFGER